MPRAFVLALQDLGGTALANTEVTGFVLGDGRVTGVETSGGRIDASIVVDAAGAWTRLIGGLAGQRSRSFRRATSSASPSRSARSSRRIRPCASWTRASTRGPAAAA